MSLRSRLMLAFAYLLVLAVVALSVPLAVNVARRARNEFAVGLTLRAETVAAGVPDALQSGALSDLVGEDPEVGRVIVTDDDGILIADSRARRPLGRDYTYREEIRAALRGRVTRAVREYPNQGLQYFAAVPVIDGGQVVGAVRVNQRVATVDALVRRRLAAMLAVSVAVLVVGLIVAAALAGSLTRPLRRLAHAATALGAGDFNVEIPESGQREVGEVGTAMVGMRDEIAALLAVQSEFLGNASHQLRTPLTGLRLRLEALATEHADAAAALSETDRLTHLVDDLLTLVRSGATAQRVERVRLEDAAEDAFDRWSITAADRGHELVLDAHAGDAAIEASAEDIAIALDNLVENALAYTPPGTTITITARATGPDAILRVSDDGPGIPTEHRDRVFDRFYRGTAAQTGTGLGLAIVRQVATRWGGAVSLDGADRGATFTITLPAADPATAERASSRT